MVGLGLILLVVSFFVKFVTLFHSLFLLIVGAFILFNTKEDKIEGIKSRGGKKHG